MLNIEEFLTKVEAVSANAEVGMKVQAYCDGEDMLFDVDGMEIIDGVFTITMETAPGFARR